MTLDTKSNPNRRRDHFVGLARDAGYQAHKLADLCDLSLRQLERHFHDDFGCTPARWLRKERIRTACGLLDEADSVKEVAFALGFQSPSHFSTLFKRETGICPSAYVQRTAADANADADSDEQMRLFAL